MADCSLYALRRLQGTLRTAETAWLPAGKAVDVKRCHSMREALSLLDFEDESISDVRALLVRAAFAPAFLKSTEGRRFLSYLFTLQVCMCFVLQPSHERETCCWEL